MKNTLFPDKYIINKDLPEPLYQQVVDGVLDAIKQNFLIRGDKIPSINELSSYYQVSRATIEKGFTDLREMGVLESIRGKGYFIANNEAPQEYKILILFNNFNPYNKIIFDSFVNTIGSRAYIDCYVYDNNSKVFNRLLEKKMGAYTHYVVMPHFMSGLQNSDLLIENLLKRNLILLDKLIKDVPGEYGAVYENFGSDIFYALIQAEEPLRKYKTIKLVFPESGYYPKEIIDGFTCFCKSYQFDYKIVSDISKLRINSGEAFITVLDEDLMTLLDKAIQLKLAPGKDIGIISYNESTTKKLILNGVTTISTDFKLMGITAAHLILNGSKSIIANPFHLRLRGSI